MGDAEVEALKIASAVADRIAAVDNRVGAIDNRITTHEEVCAVRYAALASTQRAILRSLIAVTGSSFLILLTMVGYFFHEWNQARDGMNQPRHSSEYHQPGDNNEQKTVHSDTPSVVIGRLP